MRPFDFQKVEGLLKTCPVVAIIGPRQCGKSTLARTLQADHFFDLENPRDLAALEEPQLAFESLSGVVIDEIQRAPDLFPLLRYLVDHKPEQRYLIVKSPKLYLRDSGLFHSLLAIDSPAQLATHNKLGASWQGFALETVIRALDKPAAELSFWATHSGAEVDLFWQQGGENLAVEVKYAAAPRRTPSMKSAMADLRLDHLWIIYPGDRTYPLAENITALPLARIDTAWPRLGQ